MRVGTIVRAGKSSAINKAGEIGVVYENYGTGQSIIFESGEYDGFSHDDTRIFEVEAIGFAPNVAAYIFTNVMQLSRDFAAGRFKTAFAKMPNKQILLLQASGKVALIGGNLQLKDLQKLVGGFIESVRVLDRMENGKPIYSVMYINEEGLLKELPRNEKATELYQRNVRAQYPNSETPFRQAREDYLAQFPAGTSVVNACPVTALAKGYEDDPWIAGDAVYYQGYTAEEVGRLGGDYE